jgi:hypothetical protein
MKIFFETLNDPIHIHSLILLADNGDFFYAEPVNNAVIGEGLLFNDYMFHFESNEERTKIKLKDSKNYIVDGVKGWLSNYGDIEFIHMGKDDLCWEMLKELTQITDKTYTDCEDEVKKLYLKEAGDKKIDIIEKCYIIRSVYNKLSEK